VVPADDKEDARVIVSQIVVDALSNLKMAYPRTTPKRARELKGSARKPLILSADYDRFAQIWENESLAAWCLP